MRDFRPHRKAASKSSPSRSYCARKAGRFSFTKGRSLSKKPLRGAHGPRVLHVATRAFYLPQYDGNDANSANEIPAGLDDPSLRSGLFFAGVDAVLSGAEPASDVEDGILSAYEATSLDLNGTELVVLRSADRQRPIRPERPRSHFRICHARCCVPAPMRADFALVRFRQSRRRLHRSFLPALARRR